MLLQVSFAITTAARAASSEGTAGGAVPRKRPRTDNGDAEAEGPSQHASKLFVEKPSPVALGKAIKNKVEPPGTSALHIPYQILNIVAKSYTVTLVITVGNNIVHCVPACHDGCNYDFAAKNHLRFCDDI